MQIIAAIHDGSSQGWETVYLAIHLAARLGASLLVLELPSGESGSSASEQSEKIHTAAHAAGLQADTQAIAGPSLAEIIEKTGESYVLMLPKGLAVQDNLLVELAGGLTCPIWVITYKYEIRRLGAWLDPDGKGPALGCSSALSRRLEQPLVLFAEHFTETSAPDAAVLVRALGEITPEQLAEQASHEHIDLLSFGAPQFSFFQQCLEIMDCVLALCPPEQAQALN
jgi:hypothetical protein